MLPRLLAPLCALALLAAPAGAQNRVRTETILPQGPIVITPPAQTLPAQTQPPPPAQTQPVAPPQAEPTPAPAAPQTQAAPVAPAAPTRPAQPPPSALARAKAAPEILYDLSRLPPPVARTRERMLEAARSGDIEKLVAVMQASATMPIFTFGEDKNPLVYWRTNYPDSSGVEVLSILVNVLQAGYVLIDRGTPQEMYVWPYFAFTPLATLTPQQKVELFRIVTGSDFKEMNEFGAYIFYRVGIAPDGTWHFFVSGD